MPNTLLLILVLLLLVGALALGRRLRAAERSRAKLERLRAAADAAEQRLNRRLRVAAHDLRGIGMSLHGHADQLAAMPTAPACRHTPGIASAAADLLDLADDLQDHGTDMSAPRMLRPERLCLSAVLDEAVAAITEEILPGRRNWRIAAAARQTMMQADRRALRHALSRVLTDAVRNTRHEDWIDIGVHHGAAGLEIIIADEGKGTATPGGSSQAAAQDSRGIGLRLTLARTLMAAHGGRLSVEASAGVGTRVSLVFPCPIVGPEQEDAVVRV